MRALLAKLMILMAIANAVGWQEVFASGSTSVVCEAADTDIDRDSHGESDCDSEDCAQHLCHLGHCQFHLSILSSDFSRQHSARLICNSFYDDAIPRDFRFSLIKPPTA